jgi:branched-chain amino acid aminotransferase
MAGGFGSTFCGRMTLSRFRQGAWGRAELRGLEPLSLHPGSHALHYGSACFEGLKAYRRADGGVHVFRLDAHAERLRTSATLLCLPVPPRPLVEELVCRLVDAVRKDVPKFPGALYLRPVLLGTDANVGAATRPATEALLYVIASPVGDYFGKGQRPLTLYVEESAMRTTPEFGQAKAGGNYAAALRTVQRARAAHPADQVLFCTGGKVQEAGAANFILLGEGSLITKPLDGSILAGVTRDSLLKLASRGGYRVEERDIDVDELLAFVPGGEAALSGTAAVLAGVGAVIHRGVTHRVGDGEIGAHTNRLRERLVAVQFGDAEDEFGWLRIV